jgi:acetyl esterase/lipase
VAVEDISLAGYAQEIALRSYRPAVSDSVLPIVIYFHAGGFVRGCLEDAGCAASVIASRTPAWVISVGYSRLDSLFPPHWRMGYAQPDGLSRTHADTTQISIA